MTFFGIDLIWLVKAAGYLGVAGIVFAESGLLIGFFLPGDSLLFVAGFVASQGYLDIRILVPLLFIAAVLGDNAGYAFGRKVGPKIFKQEDSLFFDKKHLQTAKRFYEAYGAKTIILARFMPIVRTFAPILAGVGEMRYRTFAIFNLVGGALWTGGLTLAGYFLGSMIPGIDRYIAPIVILIIFLSFMPSFVHLARSAEERGRIKLFLARHLYRRPMRALVRALDRLLDEKRERRIALGILFIVFGLLALVTPATPGAWLIFIGLELMGFRILSHKRVRRVWEKWKKKFEEGDKVR